MSDTQRRYFHRTLCIICLFLFVNSTIVFAEKNYDYDGDGDLDGKDIINFIDKYQTGELSLTDLASFTSDYSRTDITPNWVLDKIITTYSNSNTTSTTNYFYDSSGRNIKIESILKEGYKITQESIIENEFDSNGFIVEMEQSTTGDGYSSYCLTTIENDDKGNSIEQVIECNNSGNISTVTYWMVYDSCNNRTHMDLQTDYGSSQHDYVYTYGSDCKKVYVKNYTDNKLSSKNEYFYDYNDNIKQMDYIFYLYGGDQTIQSYYYEYDEYSNMTKSTADGAVSVYYYKKI